MVFCPIFINYSNQEKIYEPPIVFEVISVLFDLEEDLFFENQRRSINNSFTANFFIKLTNRYPNYYFVLIVFPNL
jgi:hypothetical protein